MIAGDASDPSAECDRVRAAMSRWGAPDLCVLGLGGNGHLAMNEPSMEFLESDVHIAKLAESTLGHSMVAGVGREKLSFGITLGMGDLLGAATVILVVNGQHKAHVPY